MYIIYIHIYIYTYLFVYIPIHVFISPCKSQFGVLRKALLALDEDLQPGLGPLRCGVPLKGTLKVTLRETLKVALKGTLIVPLKEPL